jgi:hypothetical protein
MSSDEPAPIVMDARAFLDWVSTQRRSDLFKYTSTTDCAVAQYLRHSHPYDGVSCGSTFAVVWNYQGTITHRYNMPDVVVAAFKRLTIKKAGRYAWGELADALGDEMLEGV